MGKYCYVASVQRRATEEGEGRGHIESPRAQLVDIDIDIYGTVVTFNIVVSIGS